MVQATQSNSRYVTILAAVSALILTLGALFRPAKPVDDVTPQTLPQSELTRLERLAERRSLDGDVDYFASVARNLDGALWRLTDVGASAIAWNADLLVTARPGLPVPANVTVRTPGGDVPAAVVPAAPVLPFSAVRRPGDLTLVPAIRAELPARPGDRLIAVWQGPGDRGFVPGYFAETRPLACSGFPGVEEAVTTVSLAGPMVGGGLFDLDGRLHAVLLECDGRPAAVTVSSLAPGIRAALQDAETPAVRVLAAYGVRVRPAGEQDARSAQPVKGLVVETAWDAYRLGAQLSPGDVIDAVDGTPVTDAVDLLQLAELPAGAAHSIRVLRGAAIRFRCRSKQDPPGPGTGAPRRIRASPSPGEPGTSSAPSIRRVRRHARASSPETASSRSTVSLPGTSGNCAACCRPAAPPVPLSKSNGTAAVSAWSSNRP